MADVLGFPAGSTQHTKAPGVGDCGGKLGGAAGYHPSLQNRDLIPSISQRGVQRVGSGMAYSWWEGLIEGRIRTGGGGVNSGANVDRVFGEC